MESQDFLMLRVSETMNKKLILIILITIISGCTTNKPEVFVKKVRKYRPDFNLNSTYCPVISHPYLFERKMEEPQIKID